MKPILITLGWLALVLATLGVFLPLVPTTPFLLLAAACFARASPRMHQALLNNRVFGPYLYDYQVNKGLTLRTKIVALSVLWVSICYSMYSVSFIWLRWLLLATALGVSFFLSVRLKTLPVQSNRPSKKSLD